MDLKEFINQKHYRTDKFTGHSYLDTYHSLLSHRKDTIKNVLEIGISKGGSILLWRDFFPNAQIYAVDIEDTPEDLVNDSQERMTLFKANAYDVKFVEDNFIKKGLKFDLIIDDGPHTMSSWMFFATHYPQLLSDNGIFVIEDIPSDNPNRNIPNEIKKYLPPHLQAKAKTVNLTHIKNRWDDIMVVLEL